MTHTEKAPEKIKLFNKGKSTIYYGDAPQFDEQNRLIPAVNAGKIRPDECVGFDPELAAKLKRLYPKKLLSLDDVREQFEAKHKASEPQDIKSIVAEAVAKAVAEALAVERARALKEIEESSETIKPEIHHNKDQEIPLAEETEEELLAKLELEQAAALAAKADKTAAKKPETTKKK